MKNIKLLALLIINSFIIYSCSTDDKTVDELFDTVERGAILRTLNFTNTYNIFDPTSTTFNFNVSVEAQGGDPAEIRLYQSFIDNTDDGTDNSKAEVLVSSMPGSSLTTGANGFPQFDATLDLSQAVSASGLAGGEYFGGDQFLYRFELELTDGRVFSTDVGGTVSGGSFFSSPFQYLVTIKCVPVTPFAGDYELQLVDSYGDGWDGAFITVTIDGVSTDYTATGSGTNHTVTVPGGTTTLTFTYTPGAFEGEHTYKIIGPFGEVAAEDGPGPAPGEIILNICN